MFSTMYWFYEHWKFNENGPNESPNTQKYGRLVPPDRFLKN